MTHTIVLIEDNEGDIVLIKEALKESNFKGKIIEMNDGNAAINLHNCIIIRESFQWC